MKDYMLMYVDADEKEIVYKKVNNRWEVGIARNDHNNGFTQVSFVNSILTSDGGKHVDYITEQICPKLVEHIKKKSKAAAENLKPMQVKTHLFVFVNCLIENPEFESQAKKQLATERKHFGSTCHLKDNESFLKEIIKKTGIVEAVINWLENKQDAKLQKQSGSKTSKLKGIPKLDDANDAGTKNSVHCTLIVTEGDSAKALAVAGLGVIGTLPSPGDCWSNGVLLIGRDRYGVYPLKGKMLNVREATTKKMTENSEISQLVKILGLNYGEKYASKSDLSKLRYGKLMIMADQDQDGSHIKGLVINFIHYKWPNLLKHDYIEVFITPILKVTKSSETISFYSMPEFEQWQSSTPNWQKWKCKYYKGLFFGRIETGLHSRRVLRSGYFDCEGSEGILLQYGTSSHYFQIRLDQRWFGHSAGFQQRSEWRSQGLDQMAHGGRQSATRAELTGGLSVPERYQTDQLQWFHQ